MNDVKPYLEAKRCAFSNFKRYFNINAPRFLSLPSIAMHSLFQMVDKSCSPIVTLGPKHADLQKYFRSQVNGGLGNCSLTFLLSSTLVSVFCRHINLEQDERYPRTTRIAHNGRPFTFNCFLDFKWVQCIL